MTNEVKEDKDTFGTRIKGYESETETYLDKEKYTIVRIDGHGFSKWTKGWVKPFDEFLVNALASTAQRLMEEFHAVTAYSQSDEITLILAPDDNLIYSGRVQKMTSLMASFASMCFNELIRREIERHLITGFGPTTYMDLLESKVGRAFFDARVFQVPNEIEAFNTLLWRTKDCERNSKNVFAQSMLSHKQCHKKTSDELVDICAEMGKDWNDLPDSYKYGIMWKKELYSKEIEFTEDGRNFLTGSCLRTRFTKITKRWSYSDDNVVLVIAKKI
jgi:tRNA(His) 5'-end guanylyltransferase